MANQQEFSPIRVDEFGTSRPDDFDAVYLDGYAVIRKSQKGNYGVYTERVLQIDGMDQPYIERDYLGFLANQQRTRVNLAPSKDGKTFANGAKEEDLLGLVTDSEHYVLKPEEEIEYSGPYVIGTAKKLPPGNWSQFMNTVKRLFPDPEHPEDVTKTSFGPLLDPKTQVRFDFAKGHKFHFVRLDQDKGGNKDKEGGGDTSGDFKVLCAQAYLGEVGTSTGSSPATTQAQASSASQPASASVAAGNGDLSSRVEVEVLTHLSELAGEGKLPIKRALINGKIVGKFPGAEMGPALALLNNEKWMGDAGERPWKLENGMLSLG